MKFRRLILNIYIGGVVAAHWGCGTQDYDLEPKETISPVVDVYDWEKAVEDSKNRPASLSFGGGVNAERGAALQQNEECPVESLCIESPFFGALQMKALSTQHPDFEQREEGGKEVVTYKASTPLVIKAEVVEIGDGLRFESCAKFSTISARIVGGRGEFKTSSSLCETKDAGDLRVAALEVKDILLNTSGSDGSDGKNGEDSDVFKKVFGISRNEVQASARTAIWSSSNWFKVDWGEAYDTDSKGPICVTEMACQYKNSHFKAHKDGKFRASSKPWETAQQNLEWLKRSKMWPVAADNFLNNRRREMAGCWVETKPFLSVGGDVYAGLYLDWKISVNKAALKGADSLMSARGEAGESGGNAGVLSVVTLSQSGFDVEASGGKAGENGKHFYAEPGRGAEFRSGQSFEPRSAPSRGLWVSCFRDNAFTKNGYGYWLAEDPLKNQKGFFARQKDQVAPQPALRKHELRDNGFVSWEVVDWPIQFQLQTDKISPRSNQVFGRELRQEGNKLYGEAGRAARAFEELPTPSDGKSKEARLQFVDEPLEFFSAAEAALQGVDLPKSLSLEWESLTLEEEFSSESAER